jgi:hypothetical protein
VEPVKGVSVPGGGLRLAFEDLVQLFRGLYNQERSSFDIDVLAAGVGKSVPCCVTTVLPHEAVVGIREVNLRGGDEGCPVSFHGCRDGTSGAVEPIVLEFKIE